MNELEQFKTVHGVSWSSLDTGGISMESKTTAIRLIKQEIRLREWSAQVKAQQASGMTVRQWCTETESNQPHITTACGFFVRRTSKQRPPSCH